MGTIKKEHSGALKVLVKFCFLQWNGGFTGIRFIIIKTTEICLVFPFELLRV